MYNKHCLLIIIFSKAISFESFDLRGPPFCRIFPEYANVFQGNRNRTFEVIQVSFLYNVNINSSAVNISLLIDVENVSEMAIIS